MRVNRLTSDEERFEPVDLHADDALYDLLNDPSTPTHSNLCLGVHSDGCLTAALAQTAKFAETQEKTIMQAVTCLPRTARPYCGWPRAMRGT